MSVGNYLCSIRGVVILDGFSQGRLRRVGILSRSENPFLSGDSDPTVPFGEDKLVKS